MELLLPALACACVGAFVGAFRGQPAFGAVMSFFLGPFGWFVALLARKKS